MAQLPDTNFVLFKLPNLLHVARLHDGTQGVAVFSDETLADAWLKSLDEEGWFKVRKTDREMLDGLALMHRQGITLVVGDPDPVTKLGRPVDLFKFIAELGELLRGQGL